MEINYIKEDKTLVLKLTEELDHHVVEKIRRKADYEMERYIPRKVIFDFNNVSFMDSAGIGLIMGRYKKIRDIGSISVAGVNESIKRILLISGLHKIVRIYDNLQSAVINGGRKWKRYMIIVWK